MTMNGSRPPKAKRRWYRFTLRTLLIVVLVVISGCGPSNEEQTMDIGNEEMGGLEVKEAGNATVVKFKGDKLDENSVLTVRERLLGLAEQKAN
jgi:hypothetical protein